MFKDTQEALKKLEEQLLDKEAPTQVLPSVPEQPLTEAADSNLSEDKPAEHPGRYQNFANNYGGKIPQPAQEPEAESPEDVLAEIPEEVPEEQRYTGLWILLIALLAANLGIILYWTLRFTGAIG